MHGRLCVRVPSLPTSSRRPAERAVGGTLRWGLLLCGLLGIGATAGCETVWGSLSVPAAENCVLSTNPCTGSLVCNPVSQLCEEPLGLSQISPARGPTEQQTAVTLTGTNFVPGMTVKWNGTALAAVTVDSPTQLHATAPVSGDGAWRVTVELSTPKGATVSRGDLFSYYSTTLTFLSSIPDAANKIQGMYAMTVVPAARSGPATVVFPDSGQILRGVTVSSDGLTATDAWTLSSPQSPSVMLPGDLNGDGIGDFMIAAAKGLYWYRGNSDSSFEQYAPLATGLTTGAGLGLGDLNRDGQADLVGIDYGNQQLVILSSKGSENLPLALTGGHQIHRVVVAELDGLPGDDIALTYEDTATQFGVIRGGTTLMPYPDVGITPCNTGILQAGRFGAANAALILTCDDGVRILQATGGGAFSPVPGLAVTANFPRLVGKRALLADFDGDGDLDVIAMRGPASAAGPAEVWWLANVDGRGTLVAQKLVINLSVPANCEVDVGDMDGDGKPDVVIGNHDAALPAQLTVLFNRSR